MGRAPASAPEAIRTTRGSALGPMAIRAAYQR
jgi:hypothetical protein